ncbi:hypothetical protein [Shewanella waksmanii]|uniref:hypothetical protein n=1 Tax=Shewanella waksmanii TaxID=213783 RepID=UPI00048B4165|nr:hypothetical protein [Shewanella waksmanii]
MNIVLDEVKLNLGIEANSLAAVNLPYVETQPCVVDEGYVTAFFADSEPSQTVESSAKHISSLVGPLLQQLSQQHADFHCDVPVFWLLPESSNERPELIENWLNQLQQDYPQLFAHGQSQIFPYGRAALPIALASLSALQQQGLNRVALIAVDTAINDIAELSAANLLITADSSQGVQPSEGAVLALISLQNSGLSVEFTQQALATLSQRRQAVGSLFNDAASFLNRRSVAKLYAPGNGEPKLLQDWLDGYIHLANNIDRQSEVVQTGYYTGELGGVTGLYNLIHIYHSYQQGRTAGTVVQLELSESLHHGLAIYSWTGNS